MISLSANWSKRLEAAQLDPSWQSQLEARVLRFLLSRYGDANEEAPLPDCPFFQGEAPHGRAKLPLSQGQLRARLSHIAQVGTEFRKPRKGFFALWDKATEWQTYAVTESSYRDAIRRRKKREAADKQNKNAP